MKTFFYTFLLFVLHVNVFSMSINRDISGINLLSHSDIYIDKNSELSYDEVIKKEFIPNTKNIIGLGIVPSTTLWIKFKLSNQTNEPLTKILEYANPETEDLHFYDGAMVIVDGMFHHSKDRESINPTFLIKLDAHEERTYYIKAHCKISTLIAKLTLWNENDFLKHDYKHKTYIFIFFASIFTLLIYNLMLYIFTMDKAYLYYILYLSAMMIFQSIFLGFAQLYLLSNELTIIITKATITYISLLLVPIILFTIEFLNIYKYKKLDTFFKVYLYAIPIICVLSYDNFIFDANIMIVFIPLAFMLVYAGFYTYFHGEKQAFYYIISWSVISASLLFSVLQSLGLLNISKYFLYTNEVAFTIEAILFSIALAHRIKISTHQKHETDKKILKQLVDEKTQNLILVFDEKDILYRELNHRVKNNMQMILSLIKLQISKSFSQEVKAELTKTKNRIDSMSHLYQALHTQEEDRINTLEYLRYIAHNVEQYFSKNTAIDILYTIEYNLSSNHLNYCGLIINELITNSFKYAFQNRGIINIKLYKRANTIHLIVQDNGRGFKDKKDNSLGLSIVKTLVQKQLYGKIKIDSEVGVGTKVSMEFEDDK